MKLPFSAPLWFALTVLVPGAVIYALFRVLVGLLGVSFGWFTVLDESEVITASGVVATGILVQLAGIIVEDGFFATGKDRDEKGPKLRIYRHRPEKCDRCRRHGPDLDAAFDRYESTFSLHPEDSARAENVVAQFFMSHNIAVGVTALVVVLAILVYMESSLLPLIVLIATIFVGGLAWYVAWNRYHRSSRVLFDFEADVAARSTKAGDEDAPEEGSGSPG